MSTVEAAPSPELPGHPSAPNNRCATRADLRGDPMLGTAFPAARLLLIEQPGPWGRRGLRDSLMPGPVADEVERRANVAGFRVQVIRRPGRDRADGDTKAWAVADTRPGHESVRWGSWTRPDELLELPLNHTAGTTSSDPVYLVCAHSKHDVCCALRGRPMVQALDAARPGQVWETSHLGGDRFGANVLTLPLGMLYGRVLPFAAADLAAATEAGEVVLPVLRGRIGTRPAVQAALAHAAGELGMPVVADLVVEEVGVEVSGQTVVHLGSPRGRVEVTVRAEQVAADGLTCANPRPSSFTIYRAVRLRAAV